MMKKKLKNRFLKNFKTYHIKIMVFNCPQIDIRWHLVMIKTKTHRHYRNLRVTLYVIQTAQEIKMVINRQIIWIMMWMIAIKLNANTVIK
jgi:hypothetical protein